MERLVVLMSNEGGELDRAYAANEYEAARALINMVRAATCLNAGDRFEVRRVLETDKSEV